MGGVEGGAGEAVANRGIGWHRAGRTLSGDRCNATDSRCLLHGYSLPSGDGWKGNGVYRVSRWANSAGLTIFVPSNSGKGKCFLLPVTR